jgi:hypothetical protein
MTGRYYFHVAGKISIIKLKKVDKTSHIPEALELGFVEKVTFVHVIIVDEQSTMAHRI